MLQLGLVDTLVNGHCVRQPIILHSAISYCEEVNGNQQLQELHVVMTRYYQHKSYVFMTRNYTYIKIVSPKLSTMYVVHLK